jgi:hypothetical protein
MNPMSLFVIASFVDIVLCGSPSLWVEVCVIDSLKFAVFVRGINPLNDVIVRAFYARDVV